MSSTRWIASKTRVFAKSSCRTFEEIESASREVNWTTEESLSASVSKRSIEGASLDRFSDWEATFGHLQKFNFRRLLNLDRHIFEKNRVTGDIFENFVVFETSAVVLIQTAVFNSKSRFTLNFISLKTAQNCSKLLKTTLQHFSTLLLVLSSGSSFVDLVPSLCDVPVRFGPVWAVGTTLSRIRYSSNQCSLIGGGSPQENNPRVIGGKSWTT